MEAMGAMAGVVAAVVTGLTMPEVPRTRSAREGHTTMLNTRILTWALGLFGAVSFIVCVLYGLIVPEPLHMTPWLEQVLPGFRWLSVSGFLIGLAESFLYGVYAGLVFSALYNALWRRWGRQES